jgi:hypothetical protein
MIHKIRKALIVSDRATKIKEIMKTELEEVGEIIIVTRVEVEKQLHPRSGHRPIFNTGTGEYSLIIIDQNVLGEFTATKIVSGVDKQGRPHRVQEDVALEGEYERELKSGGRIYIVSDSGSYSLKGFSTRMKSRGPVERGESTVIEIIKD